MDDVVNGLGKGKQELEDLLDEFEHQGGLGENTRVTSTVLQEAKEAQQFSNVAELQEINNFNKSIETKCQILADGHANHKFAKTWLSWIKVVVVIIYFLVIPFSMAPDWCTDYFAENPSLDEGGWTVECQKVVVSNKISNHEVFGQVRYSDIWMFKPVVSAVLDLICVGYLTFFRFYKLTYREMSTR